MSLATFGVQRLLRFVLTNKNIKNKRETFLVLDLFLQAALVGNILWAVMFVSKEIIVRNYIILVVASIASGIVSSYIDTKKIFSRYSKVKTSNPLDNDKYYLMFYLVFTLVYLALLVIVGIKLF